MEKKYNNTKATEKVQRKVMFNEVKEGGLNMVNIHQYQHSILLGWAENIISARKTMWKDYARSFFVGVGGIQAFKSKTSSRDFKGVERIASPFWRSVLVTWLDKSGNDCSKTLSINDPLFNNSLIKYGSKSLFFAGCIEKGIISVKDMVLNGAIISLEQFQEKYEHHPRGMLEYVALYNALKPNIHSIVNNINEKFYFREKEVGQLGRHYYYRQLHEVHNPPCGRFWKRKYNIDLGAPYWDIIHNLKESRLKGLSWKILHNIYPTNILLFKMKISQSMSCPHCNETDFIEHFFFLCPKIRPLWKKIENDINFHLNAKVQIDEKLALMGLIKTPMFTKALTNQINTIIAIARSAISKYRYGKSKNLTVIFESELRLRKIWLKYSTRTNRL